MSLVDVELILSIVDGDRAEAATLISVFFDSAQEQTSAMEAAIRSGDAHALSRAAHQIAGAAGTCGFAEIERNFREI
ncbi:MAG: Hpt domain-containing protein [Kiritimatiellia bacterium]|nr:Hpt domain-containing protein [Kiritimatiellia bacterium]